MDLVDYNKVIDALRGCAYPIIGRFNVQEKGLDLYTIHLALRDLDRVDAEPVIHAHWKIIYESSAGVTDAKCSNCGFESLAYENDVHTDKDCHYCPCCGAKMDGEVESYKEVGKRMADGFAKGFENNVRSVGQQLCNDEE